MDDLTARMAARPEWLSARQDPVRAQALRNGAPNLDEILKLFPHPAGEPAFDAEVIASSIARLQTTPEIDTGHPFLDLSVKTGLAFIDATFQGDHPKYGIKCYGQTDHDTFPPTIIATVDALSAWGLHERAARLWRYWLSNFVREDGTIRYRGTSLSEYGQLLHTAALLAERAGTQGWADAMPAAERLAVFLLDMLVTTTAHGGLLHGVPEDDEKDKPAIYFHNNAWVAVGLQRWAGLCGCYSASTRTPPAAIRAAAERLASQTVSAIRDVWPAEPADWWLPPQVEPIPPAARPRERLTATRLGSYTNYRYWPELLASGILPADLAHRLVDARLAGGGQFCGITRFEDWLDDWPLADYLSGLWALGRQDDFLLSLYGHVAYHQAEGHLTAYEQVTLPPGREKAPYCLPCQLVAARAARRLQR